MSRPEPEVIHSTEVGDTTWEILHADAFYAITYKTKPIAVRLNKPSMSGNCYLYKKMTYTNLGNALTQMRKLNRYFKCEDFDVMEVV